MAEDLTGAYNWAIERCNNPNVGYSQAYRNEQTINGITYYDCSSFIWYALLHNGWDCITANGGSSWPFTTSTMSIVLPRLGFTQISQNGIWKPMDIVLNPGSHTEFVYTGGNAQGVTMGAHTDSVPLVDQVSINNYTTYAGRYTEFWRYTNGEVRGYNSWMGWIPNESIYDYLDPRGLAVNGDSGQAYGMYQFDYRYGLVPFMQYCLTYDSSKFSGFAPYIAMGAGNSNLVANPGLIALFQQYANDYTDEFQYLQDAQAIQDYLTPAMQYVQNNYGVDVTTRDPTILGTLFSMSIRAGYVTGAQCFSNIATLNDLQLIGDAYNKMSQIHYDAGRWITGTPISQLDKCINAYYTQVDFYIIPYGGYTPTPPVVRTQNKLWMYQKNRLYQRRLRHERFR